MPALKKLGRKGPGSQEGGRAPSRAAVYARAARSIVPIPLIGTGAAGSRGGSLPDVRIVREATLDREAVAAFCAVVHAPLRTVVPASYLHTLGFLPAMEAMTAPGFPVPVLGMVHTHNRFAQHRAASIGERLTVTVTLGAPRAHKRGAEIPVQVTAVGDDGIAVFHEESLYLAKGRKLAGAAGGEDAAGDLPADDGSAESGRLPFAPDATPTALWRLRPQAAKDYARVSGDLNPIHLSRVAARAFGFPATIAHGMYTAARGLAQVDPRAEAFTWEVQFASPLVLPAAVGFAATDGPDGGAATRYQVFDPRRGKPFVVGLVTSAE